MFFAEAMQAHVAWSNDFLEYVHGVRALDVSNAGRDDACRLGRLLSEQKDQFGATPEFVRVADLHRRFHTCAGAIVAALKADKSGDDLAPEIARYKEIQFHLFNALTALAKLVEPPPPEDEAESLFDEA
jgi:hypothetical protein